MVHAELDLSRKRLDYCLLTEQGERLEVGATPPDGDGLRGFVRGVDARHGPVLVRAAIESCPKVYQSGNTDRRGHLAHAGPKYLRWALMEAAARRDQIIHGAYEAVFNPRATWAASRCGSS